VWGRAVGNLPARRSSAATATGWPARPATIIFHRGRAGAIGADCRRRCRCCPDGRQIDLFVCNRRRREHAGPPPPRPIDQTDCSRWPGRHGSGLEPRKTRGENFLCCLSTTKVNSALVFHHRRRWPARKLGRRPSEEFARTIDYSPLPIWPARPAGRHDASAPLGRRNASRPVALAAGCKSISAGAARSFGPLGSLGRFGRLSALDNHLFVWLASGVLRRGSLI
jgi:hypothetical protein